MIHMTNEHHSGNFDCAFNGIDEPKLVQLLTAEFIQRGENLLLIGEAGSGKTAIVREIETVAATLGLSSKFLVGDWNSFESTHFIEMPNPLDENVPTRFFPELLAVDVLIVNEAQRWLEVAPHELTYLVCQRIALGKSNIFLVPSHGWENALWQNIYPRKFHNQTAVEALSEMAERTPARWAETIPRHHWMSFDYQIQVLGIGLTNWEDPRKKEVLDLFSVPNTHEAQALKTMFNLAPFAWCEQSLTEWMLEPGWKPVWHVLYTGANNYRRFLER